MASKNTLPPSKVILNINVNGDRCTELNGLQLNPIEPEHISIANESPFNDGDKSIKFTGISSYQIPSTRQLQEDFTFENGDEFTISFWVKILKWGTYKYCAIMDCRDTSNPKGAYYTAFAWYNTGSTIHGIDYFYDYNYNTRGESLVDVSTPNIWHHCAVTRKDNKIYTFIDGKAQREPVMFLPVISHGFTQFLGIRSSVYGSPDLSDCLLYDLCVIKHKALWTAPFEVPKSRLLNAVDIGLPKIAYIDSSNSIWGFAKK